MSRRMLNKTGSFLTTISVVLACGLNGTGLADDTGMQLEVSNAEQLCMSLFDNFQRQGSFQAEYQAIGSTNSANISLLLDNDQEFCFMKLTNKDSTPASLYTVVDFSESGPTMLFTDGETAVRINFRAFFQTIFESLERPDNPVGWFVFIVKSFAEESKTQAIEVPPLKKPSTTINLGLSADRLIAGIAFSSNESSSWLSPNNLTNATSITEYDDSILFSFENNHTVLIDKHTGLLLKDNFPYPANPAPREITLIRRSSLKNGEHYSNLIPEFSHIVFEEIEPDLSQLKKEMSLKFLTSLGRSIGETEGLEELLGQYSQRIQDRSRTAGCSVAREVFVKQSINADELRAIALANYEKFKASLPDTEAPVSFSVFVDMLKLELEKSPDITRLAGKLNNEFCQTCQRLLMDVPEDARVPLQLFFDRVMPSFAEGFSEEFIQCLFDQVKTVN